MKKILWILILTILIIPVVKSLVRPGFFSMYDDMQIIRLKDMDSCIKDGQIPCRWVPDLGYGYGYPLYIYYAPLPYYAMELVHLGGLGFIDSVKAGFILSVILSAIFFYLFLRNLFSKEASLFGTILYLYAPFRAAEIFVRGGMGEAWGLMALPLVLWGFENLIKNKNKISMGIFTISVGIYMICHNLTVLMTIPLVAGWIILRIIQLKIDKKTLGRVIISGAIGLAISAFFWLPLFIERNLVHLETLTSGYFNYLAHFINLKQIFISTRWGYGPSIAGPNDSAFLGLGPIGTFAAVLGFIYGLITKKKEIKTTSIFFVAFFILAAFLSHERSTFIWKALPFMEFLQFPWRFMLLATFCSSVLGAIFASAFKGKIYWVLVLILLIATFALYGNFYRPKDWFDITDAQKLSGDNLERQITASIYDYLPKSASKAPTSKVPNSLIVLEGVVNTVSFERGTNWYKVDVKTGSGGGYVSLPAFDFPNWEVIVNGGGVKAQATGQLGLVSFKVPAGDAKIEARLIKPWYRSLADIISLIGALSVISLFSYEAILDKINKK
ncbi:YfhO family protein [Patescibacteria group bacterium]|nr:YfhO family protein [Patescibacteria group bacterium]